VKKRCPAPSFAFRGKRDVGWRPIGEMVGSEPGLALDDARISSRVDRAIGGGLHIARKVATDVSWVEARAN
jgi:hypothetical protein